MNTISSRVDEIDSLVRTSLSVSELTLVLTHKLDYLRKLYATDKTLFLPDQVNRLRFAASVPDLIAEFMEAMEERSYITHQEDVEELVAQFAKISDALPNCRFAGRAEKEARELVELHTKLPTRFQIEAERLRKQEPPCPKCGSKLVLRESMHGLFWGCREFPLCYGKLNLTREQAELLRDT